MDHREHIQNMLDGTPKRAEQAIKAAKLRGTDAQLARIEAHLHALDGCVKVLANAVDRLWHHLPPEPPDGPGWDQPAVANDETT